MKIITTIEPSEDERVPHRIAAKMCGVTIRTLDRWVQDGIIEKPEYFNGRKYHWYKNLINMRGAK